MFQVFTLIIFGLNPEPRVIMHFATEQECMVHVRRTNETLPEQAQVACVRSMVPATRNVDCRAP